MKINSENIFSFGTTAALLQEIVNIYSSINPPTLTAHQSNRFV